VCDVVQVAMCRGCAHVATYGGMRVSQHFETRKVISCWPHIAKGRRALGDCKCACAWPSQGTARGTAMPRKYIRWCGEMGPRCCVAPIIRCSGEIVGRRPTVRGSRGDGWTWVARWVWWDGRECSGPLGLRCVGRVVVSANKDCDAQHIQSCVCRCIGRVARQGAGKV
jgi:hypothetical protein